MTFFFFFFCFANDTKTTNYKLQTANCVWLPQGLATLIAVGWASRPLERASRGATKAV